MEHHVPSLTQKPHESGKAWQDSREHVYYHTFPLHRLIRFAAGRIRVSTSSDITQLLRHAQDGDADALNQLYSLVYDHLREIAHRQLRRQRKDPLQTTALVHEAYLKLFDQRQANVQNRAHFYALSARAMRQILVDHFRRHHAQKRGGHRTVLTLKEGQVPMESRADVLLALDDALHRLAQHSKRLCQVVEYKFFGGMTQEEIAVVLGVTDRTVRSDWRKARAWLAHELTELR